MADYWTDKHFCCDGILWGVAPDLSSFCAGIIAAPVSDIKAVEALSATQDIVLAVGINSETPASDNQAVVLAQKPAMVPLISAQPSKHPGGRPVKTSGFSKRTEYRRKQEIQGVLI